MTQIYHERKQGRPKGPEKEPLNLSITPEARRMALKAAYDRNESVSQLFENFVRDLAGEPKRTTAGKRATA